jgi:phosphotriesterase-related protein
MEQRNATVTALLERGYAERMFLSQDFCATLDWYPLEVSQQLLDGGAAKGWSMTLVFDEVIPALREAGMTDEQLQTMMVENPVRWLTA